MNKIYKETTSCGNATENQFFSIKEVVKYPYSYSMHWHEYYEITLIQNDNTKLMMINGEHALKKNTLVILPPYTIHDTANQTDEFSKEIVCHFTNDYFEHFSSTIQTTLTLNEMLFLKTPYIYNFYNEDAISALKKMLQEFSPSKKNVWDLVIQGNFLILLGRIFNDETHLPASFVSGNTLNLLSVKNYINEHICEKIALSQIATHYGYEPTYFSKKFKQLFGISFKQYEMSLRIQKAQQLLLLENHSVNIVAEMLNYDSPQNFCRSYKAITGVSPYKHTQAIKRFSTHPKIPKSE
ncbi:MAG: helix-turn-helix transcriptional regulator [Clostridia bacterium]|nr:helix-turn-helix transcriptional regulator [Clostridia bacterium]